MHTPTLVTVSSALQLCYEAGSLCGHTVWLECRHTAREMTSLAFGKRETPVQRASRSLHSHGFMRVGGTQKSVPWWACHKAVDALHCYQKGLFFKCKVLLAQGCVIFLLHLDCLVSFESAPQIAHFSNRDYWDTLSYKREKVLDLYHSQHGCIIPTFNPGAWIYVAHGRHKFVCIMYFYASNSQNITI